MAYQTPITIKSAIDNIQKRKYVLPSIQREFVWEQFQIEQLFDSLMRDYPISTFLFWKVDKSRIKDFQFYDFLKDFHEKNSSHNTKADLSNQEDVIAILDGQQRLTSLYIALRGSYAEKLPYYRWDSPHAFPKKKLYLNLLKPADDIEMEYDFYFLESKDAVPGKDEFWFEVSKVMEFTDQSSALKYLMKMGLTDSSKYSTEQSDFALNALSKLYNIIHEKGTVSYFLEEGEALDKVLQIFIRTNSGGTKLSYSDLLLSIATAQWKEKDAREVIHGFVDELNVIGDSFNFNKDFVLKSSLVLGDLDVKFKVDNFKKENMLKIEKDWDSMSSAIRDAVRLISQFGFNRDNLTSTNAVIPIAYYLLRNNRDERYLTRSEWADDREKIRQYLVRVLLKKTFGGTPDALYPVLRTIINDNLSSFPLEQIVERYKGSNKSIAFNDDDLENILALEYGNPLAFCALSLIQPGLNFTYRYQQDHIQPQHQFTKAKLKKAGINEEQAQEFIDSYNALPNLQLLPSTINGEKNGKQLGEWLDEIFKSKHERDLFMQQNLFPVGVSLSIQEFSSFYNARKKLMKEKLASVLGIKNTAAQPVA